MRGLKWILVTCLLLVTTACASAGNRQTTALDKAQYAWSAAIRWGDIAGAWKMLAPEYRANRVLTDAERERYKQVEVTGYSVVDANVVSETEFERTIDIMVVNRNTMNARNVAYRERWRYDPAAQAWWVTSGLPDFWDGR